jgi:uncharacterized OsmC-like protein
MAKVEVIYDKMQHCTAFRLKNNNTIEMDCQYTGKGEQFSPGDMLGSAVAGCILISMGTYAMQHEIDLTNTRVEVETKMGMKHVEEIDLVVHLPGNFSDKMKKILERSGNTCPIKHSFIPNVKLNVSYM